MKKVGILTFNRAINFGAVLQAFALKVAVGKKAHCEVVNYETIYGEKIYSLSLKEKPLKNFVKKIAIGKKHKIFHEFINENSTKKIYKNHTKREILENNFDKIIVGSDQVWNYTCSGECSTFLLDFVREEDHVDCYSYAASFGVPCIPEEYIESYSKNLKKFKGISVREETGKKILEEQLGVASCVVLDPTLLINKEEWREKLNIKKGSKRYILTYFLDADKELEKIAKELSKRVGLPIYNITNSPKNFFGNKTIKNIGPKDWVEYFYNAEFIFTSSFHGTAFAINFGKQFYTYAENNRSSRIVDLLKTVGLEYRRISSAEGIDLDRKIDYDDVNAKLKEERTKSLKFIESIIND